MKTTTSPAELLGFPLLGRSLHARVLSPAVAGWLAERWHFPEHDTPAHHYRITVTENLHRPSTLPTPSGEPVAAELPDNTLHWWNQGSCWQTGGREVGVAAYVEPGETRIDIWGAAEPGNRPGQRPAHQPTHHPTRDPALFPSLYLALNEALRASGLIPLHAAILVRDGAATALVAPSGTGKSTTLLRALAADYTPIAEDLAWLDPDSLEVHGWDRGIRLWPDTIERFLPHLAGAPWTTDADGKLFLDYAALGIPRLPGATLSRVIRLERDVARRSTSAPRRPGRGLGPLALEPTPLPRHEAVRTLWEATGVPLLPATRADLARRIPGLLDRLHFGRLELNSGS
jgi:hypothetical protein